MTMSPHDDRITVELPPDPEDTIEEAAREAELARISFHESLREASESGREVVKRAVASARPLVVGALVLGGAAIVVSAARLLRRSRSRSFWAPPSRSREPSVLGRLIRTTATRLVIAGAVKVAQHYLLPQPPEPSVDQDRPFPETG